MSFSQDVPILTEEICLKCVQNVAMLPFHSIFTDIVIPCIQKQVLKLDERT